MFPVSSIFYRILRQRTIFINIPRIFLYSYTHTNHNYWLKIVSTRSKKTVKLDRSKIRWGEKFALSGKRAAVDDTRLKQSIGSDWNRAKTDTRQIFPGIETRGYSGAISRLNAWPRNKKPRVTDEGVGTIENVDVFGGCITRVIPQARNFAWNKWRRRIFSPFSFFPLFLFLEPRFRHHGPFSILFLLDRNIDRERGSRRGKYRWRCYYFNFSFGNCSSNVVRARDKSLGLF